MRRVLPLAGLVTLGLVAACGSAPAPPVPVPTGTHLVAEWRQGPGFMNIDAGPMDTPDLAVYSDGEVVARAHRTLTLAPSELDALLSALRQDLIGLPPTADNTQQFLFGDGSMTTLTVVDADGTAHIVQAYALDVLRDYPDRLVAAMDLMIHLAARVTKEGSRYTSDRVRLVAEYFDGSRDFQAWPEDVPSPTGAHSVWISKLSGAEAAAVVRAWPADRPGSGAEAWVKTADGAKYLVEWRYLLPHE